MINIFIIELTEIIFEIVVKMSNAVKTCFHVLNLRRSLLISYKGQQSQQRPARAGKGWQSASEGRQMASEGPRRPARDGRGIFIGLPPKAGRGLAKAGKAGRAGNGRGLADGLEKHFH